MSHTNEHDQLKQQAYEAGYNDAYFDGLYLASELPCQCDKCRAAYDEGQMAGMTALMGAQAV